jgi:sugar phosphate isomerase/epimerase
MKFAICNELFEGWDFASTVKFVADAGYQGLEIAPFTLADNVNDISKLQRVELSKIAQDAGLEIVGLHWLLVKPEGLYINHSDQAIRQRTIDYMKSLVDFCGDIGGKVMIFGSPNQRKILPELSLEQSRQLATESFAACAEIAQSRGVTICLEALPAQLTNFLNTNAEVISLVKEINHPNIQMMLDVKSMCAETLPIMGNIQACRDSFRHVHANDSNLKGPGFGKVDFKPIFKTLNEVAFHDYVSVEVFDFKPDPETVATKSLEYMQQCLAAV